MVDTPIFDPVVSRHLGVPADLQGRLERARKFLEYLNERWIDANFDQPWFNWEAVAQEAGESMRAANESRERGLSLRNDQTQQQKGTKSLG